MRVLTRTLAPFVAIRQARPKQAHVLLVHYWHGRNLGIRYFVS